MSGLTICPKHKECDRSHKAWNELTAGHYGRCKPHKKRTTCGLDGYSYNQTCPPCIPYSLRVGDRVRVLGKTGCGFEEFKRWKRYQKHETVQPDGTHIVDENRNGLIVIGGNHFNPQDLEYIEKGEEMTEAKYVVKKIIQASAFYQNYKNDDCHELQEEFTSLLFSLKPKQVNSVLDNDDFITWAEADHTGKRIKWLIEKGYIEEVEPEVFYKKGDRFKYLPKDGTGSMYSGAEFIIAGINTNTLMLINLADGGRWTAETTVTDMTKITKAEFDRMCGTTGIGKFHKI